MGYGIQFEYLTNFPITASGADSLSTPYVLAYDLLERRYVCKSHLYPGVMEEKRQATKNGFKEVWTREEPIPANTRDETDAVATQAYRNLASWVLCTIYGGDIETGLKILKQYTEPELYSRSEEAIRDGLARDLLYQEMLKLQSRGEMGIGKSSKSN